jgi:hypothetical protein
MCPTAKRSFVLRCSNKLSNNTVSKIDEKLGKKLEKLPVVLDPFP